MQEAAFWANLAEADEEVKNVGVIVKHSARLHIRPKLCLALSVQGLVEIHLPLVKGILAQQHRPAESRSDQVTAMLFGSQAEVRRRGMSIMSCKPSARKDPIMLGLLLTLIKELPVLSGVEDAIGLCCNEPDSWAIWDSVMNK